MKKNIFKFIYTLGLSGLVLLVPSSALAAKVSFQPAAHALQDTKPFSTTIVINSQEENINTIEGVVKIDPRLSSTEEAKIEVSDSGSIVNYWVNRPSWDNDKSEIRFSGAIPGGFNGTTGILFSIIFPSYSGKGSIDNAAIVAELRAYKNDGLATSADISSGQFSVGDVAGQTDSAISDQLYLDGRRKDDIPPEVFSPQISRDDASYDGKWFISFATIDKQSGIDHYEVQESITGTIDSGKWKITESPYVLQDQQLHSFVYVIAVDRQGNERIIKVFPKNPLSWYQQNVEALVTLLIIILVLGGYYYKYHKPKKASNLK